MAWRLANSLAVLRDETRAVAPGTRVDTIGNEAHAATWSDHNPSECCEVVCASDTFDSAGLDLDWFADRIVATNPPALKYVIWHDRIWFPGLGWQPYRGDYHTHVHVSVGWGPDGRSTGPYDDVSPWGLLSTEEEQMSPNTPALSVTLDGTTARLVWDTPADNGQPVNEVIVRVHDRPFPQWPVTENGNVVNFKGDWGTAYVVEGLEPGATYYAQVYARNDSGWSTPGSATFVMPARPVEGGPVDVAGLAEAVADEVVDELRERLGA